MKSMRSNMLAVVIAVSAHSTLALGAPVVTANSASRDDVYNAIQQVDEYGTVIVPAGTAHWTNTVAYQPALLIQKAVTLKGGGIGNTVIINDTVANQWNAQLIQVNLQQKFIRITGFTFQKGTGTSGVQIKGSNQTFRVDSCRFESTEMSSKGDATGVVDTSEFVNSAVMVEDVDDAAWNRPLALGTGSAVFVEDCTFDNSGGDVIDGKAGGRYVFRHNRVNNGYVHGHGRDTGGARSIRSYEVYHNEFTGKNYRGAFIRGGTGRIFSNIFASGYMVPIDLIHNCACGGACGFPTCTVYPCLDQVGRSADEDQDGTQDLRPLEVGNNSKEGVPVGARSQCSFIQLGRDFVDIGTNEPTTYTYPHPLRVADTEKCVEAERGLLTAPMVAFDLEGGASREGFIASNVPGQGMAQYSFNVPEAGQYILVTRIRGNWDQPRANGFYVGLENPPQTLFTTNLACIKDSFPQTLHRQVRECDGAKVGSEQVIPTDGYPSWRYTCDYRFQEQCVDDESWDLFYDEWCECLGGGQTDWVWDQVNSSSEDPKIWNLPQGVVTFYFRNGEARDTDLDVVALKRCTNPGCMMPLTCEP